MAYEPQNVVVAETTHTCIHGSVLAAKTEHGCSCPIGVDHTLGDWLGALPNETRPA